MSRRHATSWPSRHPDEIGPMQRFEFSDTQWESIAAEMGDDQNRGEFRDLIEFTASCLIYARQNPEISSPGKASPIGDRRAMSKVASSARRLLLALDELSGFARSQLEGTFGTDLDALPVDRQKLGRFKKDLSHMADIAPFFAKRGFKTNGREIPANVDHVRNETWATATSYWERATGKRAAAYEKSQASARAPAAGKIVSFLQAFTKAIPGEQRPTGDEIRWFLRKYWLNGKKKRWRLDEW